MIFVDLDPSINDNRLLSLLLNSQYEWMFIIAYVSVRLSSVSLLRSVSESKLLSAGENI